MNSVIRFIGRFIEVLIALIIIIIIFPFFITGIIISILQGGEEGAEIYG